MTLWQPTLVVADQLKEILNTGLMGVSQKDFLRWTELPLNPQLAANFVDHQLRKIMILRLVILRQNFLLEQAHEVMQLLKPVQHELETTDAFLFTCESARVLFAMGEEPQAIQAIFHAEQLKTQADPELQDYWYILLTVLYAYLWDDKKRLEATKLARVAPSYDHPYALVWNRAMLKGNLASSAAMVDNQEEAIVMLEEAIQEISQFFPDSGTHQQFAVNALHLRAMLGQQLSEDIFKETEEWVSDLGNKYFSNVILVARALYLWRQGDYQQAHQAFQDTFEHIDDSQEVGRSPLFTYEQAYAFYKEWGKEKYLIDVLERRLKVTDTLRLRAASIFSHLNNQSADLSRTRYALALSRSELVDRLAMIGEHRDDETGQHTRRVGELAYRIAEYLRLPDALAIGEAARLHDLGKVNIPDRILLKPSSLSYAEFEEMKKHTISGAQLLANGHTQVLQLAHNIARWHHERWDGTGYPDGLSGEQIPLAARIVAVADVYDALIHKRPYKEAWSIKDAHAEIVRQAGKQFDVAVVEVLTHILRQDDLL